MAQAAHNSVVAATTNAPSFQRDLQPVRSVASEQANLPDLPSWAQSDEARAILARIASNRPDRTKQLTETMTGDAGSFGYHGRDANRLRQLFDPFMVARMDWVGELPLGSPERDKRRSAVLAYIDAHGPDALIARVLA